MSAIDGAVKADVIVIQTLKHGGTRRQADVAARVWTEERGAILHHTTDGTDGDWSTTVEYAPWL